MVHVFRGFKSHRLHHFIELTRNVLSKKFSVGDLVSCNYGNTGEGVIYRVTATGRGSVLLLHPVLSVFPGPGRKHRDRCIGSGWCHRIGVMQLREAYRLIEAILAAEMNR